jgi:hypothetical protein
MLSYRLVTLTQKSDQQPFDAVSNIRGTDCVCKPRKNNIRV